LLNLLRYYSSYLSIIIVQLLHQNHLIVVCLEITFKIKEAKTAISRENCFYSQIFFWQCGKFTYQPMLKTFSHRNVADQDDANLWIRLLLMYLYITSVNLVHNAPRRSPPTWSFAFPTPVLNSDELFWE
jgi:hypothetical protein